MPSSTRGILLFVGAWSLIPLMDAAAKNLGAMGYSIVEITWARFFFNAIVILPILAMTQRRAFRRPANLSWHAIRVAGLLIATFCYFSALQTMPLADALAIYFVYPFMITGFAPLVLGEQVGIRRWSAVLIGFLGTLIIVRPGFQSLPPGIWYLMGGALCFAFYNLYTRKLAGAASAGQILGFQSLMGTIVMTAILPFFWKTPDMTALALFLSMGLVSVLAHFMLITSYQHASASFLAPFAYFEIISATIVGFLFFADFPNAWTWSGIAVIVACGVYISMRERGK
ncbi:MAG: DMT family transporter [Fimbriimonadaceae bacterium]|nr:DMT family transporter [Alphaproteobacteria bacterium]